MPVESNFAARRPTHPLFPSTKLQTVAMISFFFFALFHGSNTKSSFKVDEKKIIGRTTSVTINSSTKLDRRGDNSGNYSRISPCFFVQFFTIRVPLIQSVIYLFLRSNFFFYKAPECFIPTSSESVTTLPTVCHLMRPPFPHSKSG